MIQVMEYEDSFTKMALETQDTIIIYGAGTVGKRILPYIDRVDYFCDKNAELIKEICKVPVLHPNEIVKLKSSISILVCVNKKEKTFREICNYLEELVINAKVFNYANNISFSIFKDQSNYTYHLRPKMKPLRVRIVSYDTNGWILEKFAKRLEENLKKMGVDVDIASFVDPKADINHHVSHHSYEPIKGYNDTLMITHVNSLELLERIKQQLNRAKMAICMSRETMDFLTANGVPRQKLCYINPGHDSVIPPKKFVLGITHRNHECFDHRKNIKNLLEICKQISPIYFSFLIMGDGWDFIVEDMKSMGFEVEYYNQFDYDIYTNHVMVSMDYYLFFGYDEGSMGFMDAVAAGIETIVTPQGFHLDIKNGISYACETIPDFVHTLNRIKEKREARVRSVENNTWMDYAKKHLEVWNYINRREELGEILSNRHMYNDGIFSVLLEEIKG